MMEKILIVFIGMSLAGFITGLGGKAHSLNTKSLKMNVLFSRLSMFSLILMFLLLIVYQFVN
jgi:hypothetical protein